LISNNFAVTELEVGLAKAPGFVLAQSYGKRDKMEGPTAYP
jgi:hypothetical protein